MKRKIGSSTGGSFQSSVIKRIQIVKVLSSSRFLTTVFDRSSGRFQTSGQNTCFNGSFHVVSTNTPGAVPNAPNKRFLLSGKLFVLSQQSHGLDMTRPCMFSFMRKVGNEWIYDVSSFEVRVNDATGDITVVSTINMNDVYMAIQQ